VLASASSRSRTFSQLPGDYQMPLLGKPVSARRRNQHARRVRYPRRGFSRDYCAHSSNAAGSPRKSARTSPAKCSEPVIRIGSGFARASISASPMVEVMEWGSDGLMMEASDNSPVRQSRSQNGAGTPFGKKNGFHSQSRVWEIAGWTCGRRANAAFPAY
jgi:hypothetical protein